MADNIALKVGSTLYNGWTIGRVNERISTTLDIMPFPGQPSANSQLYSFEGTIQAFTLDGVLHDNKPLIDSGGNLSLLDQIKSIRTNIADPTTRSQMQLYSNSDGTGSDGKFWTGAIPVAYQDWNYTFDGGVTGRVLFSLTVVGGTFLG